MVESVSDPSGQSEEGEFAKDNAPRRRRRQSSQVMFVLRRIHLYAGLFLLPWVFLYGITGAMYNHQGLLPEATFQSVDAQVLADAPMAEFPSAAEYAQQVVDGLQSAAGDKVITLADDHGAEFTSPIAFEVFASGERHVIEIDPLTKTSTVVTHPPDTEQFESVLPDLHNITLDPDPHEAARRSVPQILNEVGVESNSHIQPFAWTKLNFLARVDGETARVTYVLKDGHVDVTRFEGHDGMSPRAFFLRLHTTHVASPHWNGRSLWSIVIDVMAVAMVTWGLTGILMWWQIKRTRIIGTLVILLSLSTAGLLYLSMLDFYATTML